jgi:UDP-2-acetamido-2,6-beta-L-arabino-hexul-4-ose reductase
MIKIGITGQTGFIGSHLFNSLSLFPDDFELVQFEDGFFMSSGSLENFVVQCDVIIHLAAMNRHDDPAVIYNTNIELVQKLISALECTHSNAHILYSSSSQEDNGNTYGKSKKEGRKLLTKWAEENEGGFTGLVIPNVFGPFGLPYYNSVVATFSYQLNNNETSTIIVDGELKLIYVGELVQFIMERVTEYKQNQIITELRVPHTTEKKVSEVLALLVEYKEQYADKNIIPSLKSIFEINLFNTFRTFMDIKNHYPVHYIQHEDDRGKFVEVIRLNDGGQVSFSTTKPGITRGNHYHTRKIERFSVIKGKALIQLRRIGTDEILEFILSGEESSFVDMPIWYTHNIKNIGNDELYTIFWINEFFDKDDPDTYFEKV